MKNALSAALLGMALLSGTPVAADPTSDDVDCLIVAVRLQHSDNADAQSAGAMSHFYFMGKLDGRAPGLDLASLIVTELPRMAGAAYLAEAKRCGAELTARGVAEDAMAQALQKKADAMAPAEKAN